MFNLFGIYFIIISMVYTPYSLACAEAAPSKGSSCSSLHGDQNHRFDNLKALINHQIAYDQSNIDIASTKGHTQKVQEFKQNLNKSLEVLRDISDVQIGRIHFNTFFSKRIWQLYKLILNYRDDKNMLSSQEFIDRYCMLASVVKELYLISFCENITTDTENLILALVNLHPFLLGTDSPGELNLGAINYQDKDGRWWSASIFELYKLYCNNNFIKVKDRMLGAAQESAFTISLSGAEYLKYSRLLDDPTTEAEVKKMGFVNLLRPKVWLHINEMTFYPLPDSKMLFPKNKEKVSAPVVSVDETANKNPSVVTAEQEEACPISQHSDEHADDISVKAIDTAVETAQAATEHQPSVSIASLPVQLVPSPEVAVQVVPRGLRIFHPQETKTSNVSIETLGRSEKDWLNQMFNHQLNTARFRDFKAAWEQLGGSIVKKAKRGSHATLYDRFGHTLGGIFFKSESQEYSQAYHAYLLMPFVSLGIDKSMF